MKNLNIILFVILCLLLFFRRQTTEKFVDPAEPDNYVMYSDDGYIKGEKPVEMIKFINSNYFFVITDGNFYKIVKTDRDFNNHTSFYLEKGKDLDYHLKYPSTLNIIRGKYKLKTASKKNITDSDLNPSDYEMYGEFIGNGPQTIQRIVKEGDRIVFLIQQGLYTKIVKANKDLTDQKGYYMYRSSVNRYDHDSNIINVGSSGRYIVRKKPNKDTNPKEEAEVAEKAAEEAVAEKAAEVPEEELNPSDYEMYGAFIGNGPQTIQKIIKEGDKIVFLIQQGPYTKIVKANKDLTNQEGYYYKNKINNYPNVTITNVGGSGRYIVRKKPIKDTNPKAEKIAEVAEVEKEEELNPSDYEMYGAFIGNGPQTIQKIIKEGDRIVFLIEQGKFTKIVKANKNLSNQKPYYYENTIDNYPNILLNSVIGSGKYIVRKKPNKDTNSKAEVAEIEKEEELNPSDYVMFGPAIGKDQPIQKIIKEGDKIVFLIQQGSFTKIVKANKKLLQQTGYYYTGKIDDYSSSANYSIIGTSRYNIKKVK